MQTLIDIKEEWVEQFGIFDFMYYQNHDCNISAVEQIFYTEIEHVLVAVMMKTGILEVLSLYHSQITNA